MLWLAAFLLCAGCAPAPSKWTSLEDAERLFAKGLSERAVRERYGNPNGMIGVPVRTPNPDGDGEQTHFLYLPETDETGWVYCSRGPTRAYGAGEFFFVIWMKAGVSFEFVKNELERAEGTESKEELEAKRFFESNVPAVPLAAGAGEFGELTYAQACKYFKKEMSREAVLQMFGEPSSVVFFNGGDSGNKTEMWSYTPLLIPQHHPERKEISGFCIYFRNGRSVQIADTFSVRP